MEPEVSLPHSQVPATCPYPEPARSSPYPHTPLPEDPFNCLYEQGSKSGLTSPLTALLNVLNPLQSVHINLPNHSTHQKTSQTLLQLNVALLSVGDLLI